MVAQQNTGPPTAFAFETAEKKDMQTPMISSPVKKKVSQEDNEKIMRNTDKLSL